MKAIIAGLLALTSPAFEAAQLIETSTIEVVQRFNEADQECRGRSGTDIEMHVNCATRDVYRDILLGRGLCVKSSGKWVAGAALSKDDPVCS